MNAPFAPPAESRPTWAQEKRDFLLWLAHCLEQFSVVEQEVALALNVFGSEGESDATKRLIGLINILKRSEDKACKLLVALLSSWLKRKAARNLLAHGTLHVLQDEDGQRVVVVRHICAKSNYDYSDRLWLSDEAQAFLKELRADARAISDRLRNLKTNTTLIRMLIG